MRYHCATRAGTRARGHDGECSEGAPAPTNELAPHPGPGRHPGVAVRAAPVIGVEGLEASVGIVTLGELDSDVVAPRVVAAAAEVARRLC